VPAQAGNDAVAHLRRVGAVQGGPADPPGCDRGQPGFQPLRHGEVGTRPGEAAGVALAFQFLDLAGDLGLGPALAVTPVGRAVVFDADGDPAVPPAVAAEVDRGPPVGLAIGHQAAALASAALAAFSSSSRTNARRASAVTNRQPPNLTDRSRPDFSSPNRAGQSAVRSRR
jgi:hypothetical protein